MKRLFFTLLTASVLLTACQSDKTSDQSTESTETTDASQEGFVFQPAFTDLTWTAFKTTARKEVNGTFKEMEIKPGSEAGHVTDILNGLTFSMKTSSVFSNDAGRDAKLIANFFGTMTGTEYIKGKVTSVEGNDDGGTAKIAITLNEVEHEVSATYTRMGKVISLETSLDMAHWNATTSIEALNKVCELLHTGDDGVSKLWPDVKVVVNSTVKGDVPAS
ncbi:MAG: YceI family protein [Flavobacteriales bacterium]|nr:YceI family protein [Bacteroidota bacterium]MCB9239990.1 YceI family protein [Flavobacteriales bacterium]